ncbi:hypothetical protein [Carboxylicivirga sp. N1Y90]|uniref:hypothetical protein n=1 Tax=Carboxylicivirga fragile TaxID=3417571 RepID=UPI003D34BB9A|nr:hypothetical protein [Marinilabiliaceae bacterium N1Y90]
MAKKIAIGLGVIILIVMITIGVFVFNVLNQHKKLSQGELSMVSNVDTIPFTYSSSGHILLQARINGSEKTHSFILDSGAGNMVFGKCQREYDFPGNGMGIGIGSKGDFFTSRIREVESLTLGNGIEFNEINAKELEFNFDCSDDIYGLIGTGVMHHLVWQIDFEKQYIIVSKQLADLDLTDDRIEIDLKENKRSHHINANIKFRENKRFVSVLVDLGNSGYMSLEEAYVLKDSLNLKSKLIDGLGSRGLGDDIAEKSNERYYLLDSLIFTDSSYFVNDFPVTAREKSLNLLGLGFFEQYKTTISWHDKKLILEPNESKQNFIWKTTGFSTRYNKELNRVEITSITEDTPSSRAQVPLKAEVISINDITFTDEASYCSFRGMKFANDTIDVKIKVNDTIQQFQLVKEAIFN